MNNEVETIENVQNDNVNLFSFGDNINITFGEAESVLVKRSPFNGFQWKSDKYHYPLHDPKILSRLVHAAPHHESALIYKLNVLCRDFIPNSILSGGEFKKLAKNYLVTGNAYLEGLQNRLGKIVKAKSQPSVNCRVGIVDGEFWFVGDNYSEIKFANPIFHLKEHDLEQEIYGVPSYLSAVQSILLNESATIFRRRYYINGAHAGFIFFLSEAKLTDEGAKKIKEQIQAAKGVGNFKNLFLHIPDAKPDSVKIIPIAEAQAKDIFAEIKNTSAKDIMTAHRIAPQILGQTPDTNGGFGDVVRATDATYFNEILPIQTAFMELNEMIGQEIIKFKDYETLSSKIVAPSNPTK